VEALSVARVKVKVTDKDRGFARLAASLAGLGTITLGVQGEGALKKHPNSALSIGEVGAIHELGLGVPKRSWLVAWIDAHEQEMMRAAKEALLQVANRRLSRKKAMEQLGYHWVQELRANINRGGVDGPPLSPWTIKRKGHDIPLLDSAALRDEISYKLFLPQYKNIPGGNPELGAQMAVAGLGGQVEIHGSPQPPPGPAPLAKPPLTRPPKKPRGSQSGAKAPKPVRVGMKHATPIKPPKLPKGARKIARKPRTRSEAYGRTRGRKSYLLNWLLQQMRKMAAGSGGGGSFRNHGFTNSGRNGRTGRAGFQKRKR
jgi:hypothetical protein